MFAANPDELWRFQAMEATIPTDDKRGVSRIDRYVSDLQLFILHFSHDNNYPFKMLRTEAVQSLGHSFLCRHDNGGAFMAAEDALGKGFQRHYAAGPGGLGGSRRSASRGLTDSNRWRCAGAGNQRHSDVG